MSIQTARYYRRHGQEPEEYTVAERYCWYENSCNHYEGVLFQVLDYVNKLSPEAAADQIKELLQPVYAEQ